MAGREDSYVPIAYTDNEQAAKLVMDSLANYEITMGSTP